MESNNNQRNRESPLESEAKNTPRRSLKSSVGKTVLKGVGTGLKYLTIMPIVGTYNWTKGRIYQVIAQECSVVLNINYGLVKEDQMSKIKELASEEIDSVKIYKQHHKSFRKGAKIVGPRGIPYFKFPFTHPLLIETYPFTIDPPQRQETAVWAVGGRKIPLEFNVNTRIICRKDPLLYALNNAGRILRADPNWEREVDTNIITECYRTVRKLFQDHEYPEVLSIPVDQEKSDEVKNRILENYGVHSEIIIESIEPSPRQKGLLDSVLYSTVLGDEETDVTGFINDITKIYEASKLMGEGVYKQNLEAYIERKKKRNLFPGMLPGISGFQASTIGAN
jgi:hypothetical protein